MLLLLNSVYDLTA